MLQNHSAGSAWLRSRGMTWLSIMWDAPVNWARVCRRIIPRPCAGTAGLRNVEMPLRNVPWAIATPRAGAWSRPGPVPYIFTSFLPRRIAPKRCWRCHTAMNRGSGCRRMPPGPCNGANAPPSFYNNNRIHHESHLFPPSVAFCFVLHAAPRFQAVFQ